MANGVIPALTVIGWDVAGKRHAVLHCHSVPGWNVTGERHACYTSLSFCPWLGCYR